MDYTHTFFRESGKHLLMFIAVIMSSLRRDSNRPAILMYHSFDTKGWKYGVQPKNLKRQLDFLKRHKNVVPLCEIIDYVRNNKVLPKNTVAITIDDGYLDTYEVFFPLACDYKFPFTLFLTTDLTKKPNLGNLPRPTISMLKEMHSSGLMEIGLHGHSHEHFDVAMSSGSWEAEVIDSVKEIKAIIGLTPTSVAYPSGRYNASVLDYFKNELNYRAGLTVKSGFVRSDDNPFLLRRIEVDRNISSYWLFKQRLTPALDMYNTLVRLLKTKV